MIFPIDVSKNISNSKKLTGSDKTKFITSGFILFNIVSLFVIAYVYEKFFSLGLQWAILSEGVVCIVIGILVYRFIIFDEDDKRREYSYYGSDSFSRYMYIRKDSEELIKTSADDEVYLFEFLNGYTVSTLCFKYGSNDNYKAQKTKELIDDILNIIRSGDFTSSITVSSENFRISREFEEYISEINSIKNKSLSKYALQIADAIVAESYRESNVDVIYLSIISEGVYQKEKLFDTLSSIIIKINDNVSAFRSVYFLNLEDTIEYLSEFYLIPAIDLNTVQQLEVNEGLNAAYQRILQVTRVSDNDGKMYKVVNKNSSTTSFKNVLDRERRLN